MAEEKKPARSRTKPATASTAVKAGERAKKAPTARKTAPTAPKTKTTSKGRRSTAVEPEAPAPAAAARSSRRGRPDAESLAEISKAPRATARRTATKKPAEKAAAPTVEAPAAAAAGESTESAPVASEVPQTAAETKDKLSGYIDKQAANRARAVFAHTHVYEGVVTFSEWLEVAILHECERLEQSYNGGNQWPPLPPGRIATGRPRSW